MTYKTRLQTILQAADWSQERLAQELNVSFVTLNAWLNDRAVPRPGAQQAITDLYLLIVGAPSVELADLKAAKHSALSHQLTAKNLRAMQ